ncbi:acyltransferase family protein [Erwinia sp. CPCC 100877]|nr:acyltransferase family protein [Erwinia sp. CPCC 100877]
MSIYELLIIPAVFFIFFVFGGIISKNHTIKNDINTKNRFETIDGIRGIAAILVVTHHSILANINAITGSWKFPSASESNILTLTYFKNSGPVGVILFFMITGFLFSGKIIKSGGKIDYINFYIKRFLRIAPLCYFSVVVMLIISLPLTFNTPIDILDAFRKFFGWLCFYFLKYEGFSLEYPYSRLNGGVFWTLAIEWKVYFLMPVISVFISKKRNAAIFSCTTIAISWIISQAGLITEMDSSIIISFALGTMSYVISSITSISSNINKPIYSIATIIVLGYELLFAGSIYSPIHAMILFIAFVIMSSGNSVFGVIKNKPIKTIGVISYSIYIMHCIILNLVNRFMAPLVDYVWITILSSILIVIVCSCTYIYVERPFLKESKNRKEIHQEVPAK